MDSESSKKEIIVDRFNNEVIWGNNKDLFTKYFKGDFYINRYRIALISVDENNTFEQNISRLK